MRKVAARTPSPSSPAAWKPTGESACQGRSISTYCSSPPDRPPCRGTSCLQTRGWVDGAVTEPPRDAVGGPGYRLCSVRCRTFVGYKPLARTAGAARATELLSLSGLESAIWFLWPTQATCWGDRGWASPGARRGRRDGRPSDPERRADRLAAPMSWR